LNRYRVHPTAQVDEGASIGDDTSIWHFVHVMPGATIGAKCSLGQNVYVASTVQIGNGVRVQNNVSLYDGVLIEDEVFLGPSCVFTNVRNPRATVNRKAAYETTRVCRGATIGANATIVCGVTIGPYAFVGAGAVVTKDVAAQALVQGVPAKQVGWVCTCGETLRFSDEESCCHRCQTSYRKADLNRNTKGDV
jgi:UDP-2-acetamido-3-amino-2,3-dideoxy-glucuronate N-acetyltransferase